MTISWQFWAFTLTVFVYFSITLFQNNNRNWHLNFVHGVLINSSPHSSEYMPQRPQSTLDQVMACNLLNAKPLPKPVLANCQRDSWGQISVKFESEKNTSGVGVGGGGVGGMQVGVGRVGVGGGGVGGMQVGVGRDGGMGVGVSGVMGVWGWNM